MSENLACVVIDASGDLIIKVTEYNFEVDEVNGERPVLKEAHMKVSRKFLAESSKHWRLMLSGPWSEASNDLVELKDDTVSSLELWFRRLHGNLMGHMLDLPLKEIWHALEVCRKYFLKIEMLNSWFQQWWAHQDKSQFDRHDLQQLLYPCHEFEAMVGFAFVTRKLAYDGVGQVWEENPTQHLHLHLRPNVMSDFSNLQEQINAAKGSLRTQLHRGLFGVIKDFLNHSCACKALDRTRVWPLEDWGSKKSINQLLEGLESFKYDPPKDGCINCKRDIGLKVVARTCQNVKKHFEGLCLNCMDASNMTSNDMDAAYWKHDRHEEWDEDCSLSHG